MARGKLRTGAVLVALCAGSGAGADDATEAKLRLAREYIGYSMEALGSDAIVAQMSEPILRQIQSRQPALWAAKSTVLTPIVQDAMGASLREAMLGTDVAMADSFTLAELTALRDFYASPNGRSVMGKMPGFMGQVMPGVMERTSRDLAPMLERLAAEGVELQ
ncbi:MAG: hypothetical protein DI556_05260 [Rhodovulum sulfidophilum]|uniref:DUF2059 domain-containing protein n=1 Tax=Rhodovulum sulfidophilum TaxID=35806 RepID=A0A2W5NL57_RHOSU|nr:MAG: hypothetical protein DI556_05260 [Rhodovulum sulfidophilum]